MNSLTEFKSWVALEQHANQLRFQTLNHLNQSDLLRPKKFCARTSHIEIDFSNQRMTSMTLELLCHLAKDCLLKQKIHDLFEGKKVNQSEDRPALHTALRAQHNSLIMVNGQDIIPDILKTRDTMYDISKKIRASQWLGYSGKPIKDIVNIGIGGSDLGPKFCIQALKAYTQKNLGYHFISDIDPNTFNDVVENLNPETTLFIISSKSFTTKETLHNAEKAIQWIGKANHPEDQLIAVTANIDKAIRFGIKHILSIWDWIGGRYSVTSAINLITAIAIGPEHFDQFLLGANQMDSHFLNTPFKDNLPILLGLIGIWNNNFLNIHNLLILTYSKTLENFISYIQQLDMESNGKSIDCNGRTVHYSTGPIVWGGSGNQALHSYYQLLCQGTHQVALDFITLKSHEHELIHETYMSKKKMLTHGFNDANKPDGFIPGNTPFSHIYLTDNSPSSIGELVALYEHKIYVQSVIWNINPFDQPAVETTRAYSHYKEPNLWD